MQSVTFLEEICHNTFFIKVIGNFACISMRQMALGYPHLLAYTSENGEGMVNPNNYQMTLNLESELAVEMVVDQLADDGLQSLRSFDLNAARSAHVDCTCPHHGNKDCDCQMVVLLVYQGQEQPLTLVAHGKDGQTHFAIVDSSEQQFQQRYLKSAVLQALAVVGFTSLRQRHP